MTTMRALWTGDVVFGMITIPAKLFTAAKDSTPQFNQLHSECLTRINNIRFCSCCDKQVSSEEIVKGYPVGDDKYVAFSKEELDNLDDQTSSKQIEIQSFVNPAEIDINLWYKNYWMTPGGKSSRGFATLHKAMVESQMGAMCKVKIRSRPRWAILQPVGKMFSLALIHFGNEVVPQQEIPMGELDTTKDDQVEQTRKLIASASATFNANDYINTYRDGVELHAKAKVDNDEVVVSKKGGDDFDKMLKASTGLWGN